MTTASLLAPAPHARRGRGRPKGSTSVDRDRDIDIARWRKVLRVPTKLVAKAFDISERCVRDCVARARAYPEAAHLFRDELTP